MKLVKNNKPGMMDVFNPHFVNRFLTDFWSQDEEMHSQIVNFKPASEIIKTETGFIVNVSVPGVKKEDVKIELDGNLLVISGERKNTFEDNKQNVLRSEINYGRFSRSYTLTNDIDKGAITADFSDGMLQISLPVLEKAQSKIIEIK